MSSDPHTPEWEYAKINSEHFLKLIDDDPAWASKLTEPIAVIGETRVENSPITHLSPLLHFHRGYTLAEKGWGEGDHKPSPGMTARRPEQVATFLLCPHLKVATGHFHGSVEFHTCGIETIDEGFVINLDPYDVRSAMFVRCNHLRIARGHYPKQVAFRHCENLRKVQGLTLDSCLGLAKTAYARSEGNWLAGQIDPATPLPVRAVFESCPNLRYVPEEFLSDPTISLPREFRLRSEKEAEARKVLKSANRAIQL